MTTKVVMAAAQNVEGVERREVDVSEATVDEEAKYLDRHGETREGNMLRELRRQLTKAEQERSSALNAERALRQALEETTTTRLGLARRVFDRAAEIEKGKSQ